MLINSNKNSKITDRIIQILDLKGITKYKFSKDLNVSNGFLDKSREITTDKYANILEYLPDVNPDWLLTGEGEMLKTKKEEMTNNLNVSKNVSQNVGKQNVQNPLTKIGVPLIPIDAMAGFGTGAVQVMDYDTQTYIVPEFTELNVDFMIRVKGSSMYPKYNSGDLVACKKLSMRDIFFQWNKVYVLDTEQGAIIKRIKKGEDQEHILLISENVNYDPFELHISKIFAIALVVGVIRLE